MREKKVKTKSRILIFTLLSLVIVLIAFFIIINQGRGIIERRSYYARINVTDYYGFDLNGSALIFGAVMPGGSASRTVSIENKYGREIVVNSYISGNISQFIFVSEKDLIIEKDGVKNLSFTARVPGNADFGVYEGEISIILNN